MTVHLFRAASSPCCANGLKNIVAQRRGHFSEATVRFIEKNFYVDDGLTSVSLNDEPIQLIDETRHLCSAGKLHIRKFISKRPKIFASLPRQKCAETATDQDFALSKPLIERALDVKWCIS